ncbi:MAG: uncharacterized protein KVP18_000224 [Porospora cf. gigantea A]|uniref:uncharacterized protein n=1 Tax=Porospora cf. gigantea A TaxID=2853593 RepID=UPI003559EBC2|nr:MAG: hypothetical protein KVP18_000224 [Porospora cf. gigantea A]
MQRDEDGKVTVEELLVVLEGITPSVTADEMEAFVCRVSGKASKALDVRANEIRHTDEAHDSLRNEASCSRLTVSSASFGFINTAFDSLGTPGAVTYIR